MAQRLRWGILGTGNIARQFAAGVGASERGAVVAVGSRQPENAQAFAQAYSIPYIMRDYQQVIASPDVDAVYVSLPNTLHHAWTLAALRAGKHVLCEKPFAANTAQAQEMFDVAQRCGRVVMEAFMYRCHPQTLAVMEAVRRGTIGKVKLIRSNFCYCTKRIADNIRFRPDLAGGALMDVGCYCLNLARLIAGSEPTEVYATAHLHESGVDDWTAGLLRFGDELAATFTCGMSVHADNTAEICGSEGYIQIPVPWKPPANEARYVLAHSTPPKMDQPAGGSQTLPARQIIAVAEAGNVFGIEADDFAASVFDNQCPRISADDTLGNMRLLDQIRAQIGLSF